LPYWLKGGFVRIDDWGNMPRRVRKGGTCFGGPGWLRKVRLG